MADSWKLFVTTLNCGKKFPVSDEDAISSILEQLLPETLEHDIYAIGFQELLSTWEASFPSLTSPLMAYLAKVVLAYINAHSSDREYRLVGSTSTGAVGLVVITGVRTITEKIAYSNFRCGAFSSSLKGSASLCCNLRRSDEEQETFTFICSHLNANEGVANTELRIDNYKSILNACSSDFRLLPFKTSHIFFFGDLNFRVSGWNDMQTDYSNQRVLENVLTNYEELNKLRQQDLIFTGFEEQVIDFPPTYKYLVSQQNGYDPRRTPSWCDRILFRKYSAETYKVCSYRSVPRSSPLQFTDHQAVVLELEVPPKFAGSAIKITTIMPSTQQRYVGDIADTLIGYTGWLIAKRLHYWILGAFVLTIIYRIF